MRSKPCALCAILSLLAALTAARTFAQDNMSHNKMMHNKMGSKM